MYSQFKNTQKEYRSKTAKNKFSKEDLNSGKALRKNRESETMAMLSGFKNSIFEARKEHKKKSKGMAVENGFQLFLEIFSSFFLEYFQSYFENTF